MSPPVIVRWRAGAGVWIPQASSFGWVATDEVVHVGVVVFGEGIGNDLEGMADADAGGIRPCGGEQAVIVALAAA